MKPNRNERQSKILQLIKESPIGTQEELVERLQNAGLDVTQATVSRDIKALGVIKVSIGQGGQKYVAMERSGEAASGRLMKVFAEAVLQIDTAMNLVIVKTLPGMAQASASALDSMHLQEVVGSIAGDDTLFIATDSVIDAQKLTDHLNKLTRQ
ncbi:MAG: arginine repressor [Eubacteriales bacterium]|jgi:transcriptional regulator of arginine metabolism|nr:arginine repressor [Eubacteriales bacterium]MDD3503312.1 arginine repressor [Eubacteriales bacterium]MDD4681571.1 arginine repressor [Eubacteriales bacterium]